MTYSFVFQDGEIKSLRRTMTLDDVCIIALTKEYDTLKIEDFNGFIGKDIGSGRCIIEFNIRFGEYVLTINTGYPENLQKDTYVGLRRINGDIIDIFYYDIYKFINYGIKELIRPMPTPAQDITPLPSTSPSNTQVLLWDFCLHFSLTSNVGTEIDTEYFNHENPFPYTIPKIEDTDLVEVMPFSAFVFSGFHPDIARELLLAGRTKFKYWNTKKDGTGKIFYPGDIVYLKDFEGPDGLYYYDTLYAIWEEGT